MHLLAVRGLPCVLVASLAACVAPEEAPFGVPTPVTAEQETPPAEPSPPALEVVAEVSQAEPEPAPEPASEPDDGHADALEGARASGTLAVWEDFLRGYPDSPARAEASREIEARLDEAPPAVRAQVLAARERLEAKRAKLEDPGLFLIGIDRIRLAEPGVPPRVLMKTAEGEFLELEGGPVGEPHLVRPAPRAFEEPLLRFLPAAETLVLEVGAQDLLGDAELLERALFQLWFVAAKRAGLDYQRTRMTIVTPEDPAPPDVPPAERSAGMVQRRLLAGLLAPADLLARLDLVPDEHLDWACAIVRQAGATPTAPREAAWLAIAERGVAAPEGLASPFVDEALRLAAGERGEIGARACRWLAVAEPSGAAFEAVQGDDRERVVARLAAVVESEGSIAAAFAAGSLAREARDRACARLSERFRSDDEDDALAAGTQLAGAVPGELTPTQRVRLAALSDDWASIHDLRGDAVVPLLRLLAEVEHVRSHPLAETLARVGLGAEPVPAASELLRTEGRVRARVVAAGEALHHLFEGEARAYLTAAADPAAVAAFAERTPVPAWAEVARDWTRDAAGRDLLELVEEGKLEFTANGAGLFGVATHLENRSDHELRVLVPPGLRYDARDPSAQNMVVTKAQEVVLEPASSTSLLVPAACANQNRSIPRDKVGFDLSRVAVDSALHRALQLLSERDAPPSVVQAAVWVLTDDVRLSDLEAVQRVPVGRYRGERVISDNDILDAFLVLEEVGVDLRTKRIWQDRHQIRELSEGWSHPWTTKWVDGDR